MKELFTPLKNWRIIVLAVLFSAAALFILGDCDNMLYFIFAKCLGLALAFATSRLHKYWNTLGRLKELDALTAAVVGPQKK